MKVKKVLIIFTIEFLEYRGCLGHPVEDDGEQSRKSAEMLQSDHEECHKLPTDTCHHFPR